MTAVSDVKQFLSSTGEGRSIAAYSKNSLIFAQGDQAETVLYVQHGKIKLTVISPRGKEAVVAILGAGLFFGEGCLAGQTTRIASAIALTDCSVAQVKRAVMVRRLHDEPEFSEIFIAHLLSRNLRIEEDLVDQLFNSSEKRLARILLLLANVGQEGRAYTAVPPISQETLAEMVGTTRSRVSFFMNKFRKKCFIEYNAGVLRGGMHVHTSLLDVLLPD